MRQNKRVYASTHSLSFGRAYMTPLPKVIQVINRPISPCTLPRWHGQVSHTQLSCLSYRVHALCTNIVFHNHGIFGHCAIMIFGGSRRGRGVISRTHLPVLQFNGRLWHFELRLIRGIRQWSVNCKFQLAFQAFRNILSMPSMKQPSNSFVYSFSHTSKSIET